MSLQLSRLRFQVLQPPQVFPEEATSYRELKIGKELQLLDGADPAEIEKEIEAAER